MNLSLIENVLFAENVTTQLPTLEGVGVGVFERGWGVERVNEVLEN